MILNDSGWQPKKLVLTKEFDGNQCLTEVLPIITKFAYGDLGLINGNQCTDWSVTDVQVKVAKA